MWRYAIGAVAVLEFVTVTSDHRTEPGNLPSQITSFVGRRHEVTELKAILRDHRLVSIVGPGGVGKTRLALEVAHQVARSFTGGRWFIELERHPARQGIVDHVASTLGLSHGGGHWTVDELAATFPTQDTLLIVDNCEHLIDEVGRELANGLLRAAPGVVLIATSRQALGVTGERLLHLDGLQVPPATGAPSTERAAVESVALFVDRARSILPSFELTADNSEAVADIARRLDGLPLAIELAAARLRVLSPQQISSRLENQFRVLASSRSTNERHSTLRATIEWSYELCSPTERLCWARLSVFPADFDIDAAEAVAAGGDLRKEDVLELVGALIDKSVLRTRSGPSASVRYRFSESVRDYGRDQLAVLEPHGTTRTRHLNFFSQTASSVPQLLFGPSQVEQIRMLKTDRPNLEAALSEAVAEADTDAADDLACAIALVAFAGGSVAEAADAVATATGRTGTLSTARVRLLWLSAWIAINQGDLVAAREKAAACRRLAQRIGDQSGVVHALQYLGEAELLAGEVAAAERDCRQAVNSARLLGADHLVATTLVRYAEVLEASGHQDQVRPALQESIAISDRVGERWCRGFALWNLAVHLQNVGQPEEGMRYARAALDSKGLFEDIVGVAQSLEVLAWCSADLHRPRGAAVLLGAAEAVWTTTGAVLPVRLLPRRLACEQQLTSVLGEELHQALRQEGHSLSPDDAVAWVDGAARPKSAQPARSDGRGSGGSAADAGTKSPLTARESEVAKLVAEGLKNREIAERLVISIRTAEAHIDHILSKLGFTSRAQISSWVAHRAGNR